MPATSDPIKSLIKQAKDLGALDAKVICPRDVRTAAWVRLKCQYGCGGYGHRLTCPPHSPTPERTRAVLDEYETALLLHSHDGAALKQAAVALEKAAFLAGFYKAFALGNGPCWLCEECTLDPAQCHYPEEARPAMEACGIDVFATARAAGFSIRVLTSTRQRPDFFSLVLIN